MSSPPPSPPSSPPPRRQGRARRVRWLGIAIGVLAPLLSFLAVLVAAQLSGDAGPVGSVASAVWALVAFAGVVLLASGRTRPLGAGILIGFSVLVLVGAGTCTAVVLGGSM